MNAVRQNLALATSPALAPTAETLAAKEEALLDQIKSGLRQVTPTLLLVTIATGFAFAIGSGIGHAFTKRVLTSKPEPRRSRRRRR